MFKSLSILLVLLAVYVQRAPATYCVDTLGRSWHCTFGCCFSGFRCCYGAGYYWYGWTGIAVFFLLCLCACAMCGGYGYRRRYYTRVHTPAPVTATVVTSANTATYQPAAPKCAYQPPPGVPQSAYQPYTPPKNMPPPYNPAGGVPPPAY